MRESLESYSDSRYDRPSENWKCGHADGAECPLGPTHLGLCQASGECAPRKVGDRWECNRPVTRGGPCLQGPSPEGQCGCVAETCSPSRTLRSRRAVFSYCVVALTIGGLLIAMNSPFRHDFLAPGPLTTPHAQLLTQSNKENRCAACHLAGTASTAGWLLHAVGQAPQSASQHATSQTDLCMNCHRKTINPQSATLAHNLDPPALEQLTQQQPASRIQLVSFSPPATDSGELACAACHREHHGATHDLTRLTNIQCQNCHQQQFTSFEQGHPEFGDWPYQQRQSIAFDHVAHEFKHFRKEAREYRCQDCHLVDSKNDIVSVTGYAACNDCHEGSVSKSLAEGIPILRLPILDTNAMLDAGLDIGQWPIQATGDFDGKLPEFMQLLIAGEPTGAAVLRTLGPNFDFYDVDTEDQQQLSVVSDLVWSIKRLLNELATDPEATWRNRIRNSLRQDLSDGSLVHLHAAVSRNTFEFCRERWFLDLAEDVQIELQNQPASKAKQSPLAVSDTDVISHTPSYRISVSGSPPKSESPKRTWEIDQEQFQVTYYPDGHDDPFTAVLIELLARTPASSRTDVVNDCWQLLGQSTSIGQCVSCHSVEQRGDAMSVHWRTREAEQSAGFTRFSHPQHLIQPELSDCRSCHKTNVNADFASNYQNVSQAVVSSFESVTKQACVTCHNAAARKDACTTCHQYHVHPEFQPRAVTPWIATDTRPDQKDTRR